MSIPPLVCSTPPPPEQCEDDKDPDDFVLHYSLSQEDDDSNDFNYGNFSTYNSVQSSDVNNKEDMSGIDSPDNIKIKPSEDICDAFKIEETEGESKMIFEEDEDLNLKVNNNLSNNEPEKNPYESEKDPNVGVITEHDFQTDIPMKSDTADKYELEPCSPNNDITNEMANLDLELCNNEEKLDSTESVKNEDTINPEPNTDSRPNINADEIVKTSFIANEKDKNTDDTEIHQPDNDFEDFEDFQYISSDLKTENVLETPENPWGNNIVDDADFGDFTAKFGDDGGRSSNLHTFAAEFSNDSISPEVQNDAQSISKNFEYNDEFGDFDEFQSSVVEDRSPMEQEKQSCKELPVINLHASDSEQQIIERLNKVLKSVFPEDISGTENDFESKLEISLGETWIYLRETDVRQPYIVNWNNSLAQKTLLKALCIDSRNILFGPKRISASMPKYAANLSAAPLQPQKQGAQSNQSLPEAMISEKTSNKPTWADPFSSDGTESCNTEGSTVVETGPTDLDVFEATVTSKNDKIFSTTLSMQPIRQINLPDTHIFTPTDSETPRSKTIHYSSGSTTALLMPQPILGNKKGETDKYSPEAVNTDNLENDNEYWEFQDFKGAPGNKISNSVEEQEYINNSNNNANKDTVKSNFTQETQVLQPIKLELTMPTLNWPDPGEVKETFEDFSDFISKTSPTDKSQESLSKNQEYNLSIEPAILNAIGPSVSEKHVTEVTKSNVVDNFEDDFDMFQSAPPSTLPASKDTIKLGVISSIGDPIQEIPKKEPSEFSNFNMAFPKTDKDKSANISFENIRPIENVIYNIETSSKLIDHNFKSLPISSSTMTHSNVLLPTPILNAAKQTQKSGQILQPLSLESYSQINWPNPGIDLQDLSRFNPVETLQSLKTDLNSQSKNASPIHTQKALNANQVPDDDIWGDFVSSKPKQQQAVPKKQIGFVDDDEWTDFISSPSVNPQNGLNTISFNVHTNSNTQKSSNNSKYALKSNEVQLDIPTLNYITPKSASEKRCNDRHFQNL